MEAQIESNPSCWPVSFGADLLKRTSAKYEHCLLSLYHLFINFRRHNFGEFGLFDVWKFRDVELHGLLITFVRNIDQGARIFSLSFSLVLKFSLC